MTIQDRINELMSRAIATTQDDIAHVFVNYAGHLNAIHCHAHPAATNYSHPTPHEWPRLFEQVVHLDKPNASAELDHMIEKVKALHTKQAA